MRRTLIPAPALAFLELFARGGTYGEAVRAVRKQDAHADVDAIVATLFDAGAITRISMTHVRPTWLDIKAHIKQLLVRK